MLAIHRQHENIACMRVKNRIMISSRLILFPVLLLIIIGSFVCITGQSATLARPQLAVYQPLNHSCSNDKGNYTTTDSYSTNLNNLLSSLPFTEGNGFGFYNSSYSRNSNTTSDAIYAIGMCKGDTETTDCVQCLNTSRSALMELCPVQKEAIIWYENCMLRYSNRSIYGVMETQPAFYEWSTQVVPSSEFGMIIGNRTILLQRSRIEAAAGASLKFAEKSEAISGYFRYAWASLEAFVQCTPDLSELECSNCLLGAFEVLSKCCDGKERWRFGSPSCNFNFDYQIHYDPVIYNPLNPAIPPPGSDHHFWRHPKRMLGILVPMVVAVVLMITVGIYMKVKPHPISRGQPDLVETMDEHMTEQSLQFDCGEIRVATNNFSDANNLGDDVYGTVYRGSTSDGKSIAVRRLSMNYVKEYMEIKKEVLLMAPKLQHPNLVELLGCALEENFERLLVYELFPNATLDRIIFDRIKSKQWDSDMRYNIIVSIAGGLLHLHHSHFVHGDVNASNILIDAQMNPKISNFGMARFFAADQTQGNVNGIRMLNLISNTYMAPEAIDGNSSAESDVYSFGVLILEIVSGQEISSLPSEKLTEKDLLSLAWKNWAGSTIRSLIDPTLWTGSGIELMGRCIRIGLFCTKKNRTDRPTMSSVLNLLNISRHGIIGTMEIGDGVYGPRSRAKSQSFIAKMRSATTGIIKKMGKN